MLKEQGCSKPWTQDPTLQRYRFCNVNRNDDTVSKWIWENWIRDNEIYPSLPRAILLARMINWPDTLAEIGYPHRWNKDDVASKIGARMARGDKTWTGAYMITAAADGTPKHISVCETVDQFNFKLRPSCVEVWRQLHILPRIGGFMAAQVVADLKRTHYLGNSHDYWHFCAPGPGSMRGLNLILDKEITTQWTQPKFQGEVNKLQELIPTILDAQNTQNCLCEFSKWVRGYSRSQYNGV
jgi:hypothetical protein